MISRPLDTEALRQIARRVFWWQRGNDPLDTPIRFAAQVMTFGKWDDVLSARRELGDETFRQALSEPPSGVFDARSWHYWHKVFNITPIPPLPRRTFGERISTDS